MAVKDYPVRTSMGLTTEASDKLKAVTKELGEGIDQNRVVSLVFEHFDSLVGMPKLLDLAAPFQKKREPRANLTTVKRRLAEMSPEERRALLAEIEKENQA